MSEAVLGLDLGTSGVKAALVDLKGRVLRSHSSPLKLHSPRPGWAEQDPEAWFEAACASARAVLRGFKPSKVLALGVSGQMHSSVFLDAQGKVIRPALLWCDGRTTRECGDISRRLGERLLARTAGNAAFEGFTLPKLLWLKREEPAAYRRLSKLLLAKDYIRFRLSGEFLSEPSDASGTLMFDIFKGRWSGDILKGMGISEGLLPFIGRSEAVLGRLDSKGARALGLLEGTPIAGGGADNACGALGVGVVKGGEAVASWGTSGTVLSVTPRPMVDPGLRAHAFCHASEGLYYSMGVMLSAGAAWDWFKREFARDLKGPGADLRLNQEAAGVEPGAKGLTFLPYLQGERTPHRDAQARGAFAGFSLAHGRAEASRAVLEGICFGLKDSLEILRSGLGLKIGRVLLTGGGARSPLLRRLQADIYGLPVQRVTREEGPVFGAALLAAVAVGAFKSVPEACAKTLGRLRKENPSKKAAAAYRAPYARFRSLYPALKGAL